MKTIEPISIWVNGKLDNATIFNLTCIEDNLLNSAIFNFQLFDNTPTQIAEGKLSMNLPEYITDWVTNDAAYNWAATQLNLTIISNYVPPVEIIKEITPIKQ